MKRMMLFAILLCSCGRRFRAEQSIEEMPYGCVFLTDVMDYGDDDRNVAVVRQLSTPCDQVTDSLKKAQLKWAESLASVLNNDPK